MPAILLWPFAKLLERRHAVRNRVTWFGQMCWRISEYAIRERYKVPVYDMRKACRDDWSIALKTGEMAVACFT
jgi:hypothetical protein